ncbi:unnamed protein product [Hermetia illucens]|uniref:Ionotropic receptor n=1 Tax=Hermetia illucens TaxID=343691 RepID=A0A7R8UH20_HERIL|nr:uncharacterized protein LOC119647663 [Hermetia illucens]CAD7080666.1 unnamed protein product [Hermetia illucens]
MSDRLLQGLHQNLSVPTIDYSNLWNAPEHINPCEHDNVVLENFTRHFLLIAIIDGVTARNALLEKIFTLTYRNRMAKVIFFLAENAKMTTTAVRGLIRKCSDSFVVDVVFFQNQDQPLMFTYHPFNNLQIIKLENVSDFFANRLMNLNKHPLKLIKFNSPPKTILPRDGEQVLGYFGHLITSYLQKRNATVEIIPRVEEVSIYKEVIDYFASRELDMTFGAMPMFYRNIGEMSYPVIFEKYCVMVPAPKVVPVYRNFLQPFEDNVWIAVICGAAYMTVVTYIVSAVVDGRKDISAALTTSICFIIARGEIGIYSNLNRRLLIIYLLFFILGFILSNMYCAFLTTFLTAPSYERELKTLDDIAAAGLKIVAECAEVSYLLRHDIYKKYHPLLIGLMPIDIVKVKRSLNNTNPAFNPIDNFEYLDDIQKYQNDIKFKITDMCPYDVYYGVAFKDESILVEDFNSHIFLAQQSGLLDYWKTNAFFEAVRSGYLHLKRGNKEFGPTQLTLIHLQISFYVVLSGWAISISAFFAEHLYNSLIKFKQN